MSAALPSVRRLSPLAAALAYLSAGFEPIALHGVRREAGALACTCQKGATCGRSAGKHPTRAAWQKDAVTEASTRERFAGIDPRNVGLRCGGALRLVVLDVDGAEGRASLALLEQTHGPLPLTARAQTGSGGLHVLFVCPPELDLGALRNAVKFLPGLDVRTEGGQIAVEPSVHPSGGRYLWTDTSPLAPLPAWLHATMAAGRAAADEPGGSPKANGAATGPSGPRPPVAGDRRTLARARSYLAKMPPGVSGERGHGPTFNAALALVRGFNLPDDAAFALLEQDFNPRCVPPWSGDELRHKVESARTTTHPSAPAWGSLLKDVKPPDENDKHRAGILSGDPFEGAIVVETYAPRARRDGSGRLVTDDGEIIEEPAGAAPKKEASVKDSDDQGDELPNEARGASAPPASERRQAPRRGSPERRAAVALDPWRYHTTDTGNGERLAARHGPAIRFCHPWGKWLVWTGQRWTVDTKGTIRRRAKETALAIYAEAHAVKAKVPGIEDSEKEATERRKALAAWAVKSEARDRRAAMAELAQSEDGIPVVPEELDADPWALNVANGTLDLRTGELRPHRREDLLTKLAPVAYDPAAVCPQWSAFLLEIMGGDVELVAFLQRFVGYALSGVIREHVLVSLFGSGSNGKSTFLEIVFALLGDYAWKAPSDLLLAKKHDAHPTDKASLFGVRFAACVETAEGRALDEPKVKELTGGDTISARRMREDFWTFTPTHKLALASNHRPVIRGTDHGTWRRQKLVPFAVTIPDEKQDKQLSEKLRAELPGILRWAVEGCLAWQKEGLGDPSAVRVATQGWRDESDPIGPFLAECCELGGEFKVPAKALYAAYIVHCLASDEAPLNPKLFGRRLTERGFAAAKGTHGVRLWRGLRLLTPPEQRAREEDVTDWTKVPS